ncbi:MAG TPA: DegQ family serine endoprotease [Verrucomicrobiae bacterium]|jgi:serine protease Do|nr:DegQ family serine endoprotease [Verrucomicrobiae bacterium]
MIMSYRPALVVLALVPMAVLGAPSANHAQTPSASTSESVRVLEALESAFVSVADRVMPAVVNVTVKTKRGPGGAEVPGGPEMEERFKEFFGQEFFDRFFRKRSPRDDGRASGSGVIVDKQGLILTNAHVVENAAEVEVGLSDDRKFKATLVGRDPKTDLAVLRIEAPSGSFPVAELGDSDRLRVGQWAIAIGNPFGLDRTVTAGIISATGRTRVGVATYEAFIQTDASINPGNSGGPLLNLQSKVIGINTAIVASGQGIGFAIPINMAREVMGQLIAKGRVIRGWLGIVIQDLTPDLAAGFGISSTGGVLISDVMKDSPAETAGMRPGDVIVEFTGAPIKEVIDLQRRVAAVEPGKPAALTVIRDRKPTALTVKIGEQPNEEVQVAAVPREERLGLIVEPLTQDAAERYGLTARSGVVVTAVKPGSAGAESGIRVGDAILEVNRRPVTSVETFMTLTATLKSGEIVPVYLQRGGGGNNEYVVLKSAEPGKP